MYVGCSKYIEITATTFAYDLFTCYDILETNTDLCMYFKGDFDYFFVTCHLKA